MASRPPPLTHKAEPSRTRPVYVLDEDDRRFTLCAVPHIANFDGVTRIPEAGKGFLWLKAVGIVSRFLTAVVEGGGRGAVVEGRWGRGGAAVDRTALSRHPRTAQPRSPFAAVFAAADACAPPDSNRLLFVATPGSRPACFGPVGNRGAVRATDGSLERTGRTNAMTAGAACRQLFAS